MKKEDVCNTYDKSDFRDDCFSRTYINGLRKKGSSRR